MRTHYMVDGYSVCGKPCKQRCDEMVFRKPSYTGFPVAARQCFHEAKFSVGTRNLCKRHTPKEYQTKVNLIERNEHANS